MARMTSGKSLARRSAPISPMTFSIDACAGLRSVRRVAAERLTFRPARKVA